jgi:hypothetical protein
VRHTIGVHIGRPLVGLTWRVSWCGIQSASDLVRQMTDRTRIVSQVVHVWRWWGWFTNGYEVGSHDPATATFNFNYGGFQGGRGWQVRWNQVSSVSSTLSVPLSTLSVLVYQSC